MTELTRMSAAALAEALRSGETTSVEVTRAHLDRIVAQQREQHPLTSAERS